MAYPVPEILQYPDKLDTNEPDVRGLPLVSQDDNVWTQFHDWLWRKRKDYIVVHDWFTWCPLLQAWIFIPINFVHDFASVPRFPFGLFLRPDGILAYGATPHDFGYRFGGLMLSRNVGDPYLFVKMTKHKIDGVFENLNNKACKLLIITEPAVYAVRVFGHLSFRPISMDDIDWSYPVWHSGNHFAEDGGAAPNEA